MYLILKFSGIALEKRGEQLLFYPPKGTALRINLLSKKLSMCTSFYRLYHYLWSSQSIRSQLKIDARDGACKSEILDTHGTSQSNSEIPSILYHSKIDKIWNFLDVYKSINGIHPAYGLKKCQRVPSSILKRDLDSAIFESDGTPFIADSHQKSIIGQRIIPNVELLFSFIAYSLLNELGEYVPSSILANARFFAGNELQSKLISLYRFKSQNFIWNVMVDYYYRCKNAVESNGINSKILLNAVDDFLLAIMIRFLMELYGVLVISGRSGKSLVFLTNFNAKPQKVLPLLTLR